MKYALVNGMRTSIEDVEKGQLGFDCWYPEYQVIACKGFYLKYFKYLNDRPILPEGYENETEWHSVWKKPFNDEFVEVVCGDNNEHRADIKTPDHIIEIQRSPISFGAALERSKFYYELNSNNKMIWVVNAYDPWFKRNISFVNEGDDLIILWKYPKKWVIDISSLKATHVYLDLYPNSNNMLRIWKHNNKIYGHWESKKYFFKKYILSYSNYSFDEFMSLFEQLNKFDYIRN